MTSAGDLALQSRREHQAGATGKDSIPDAVDRCRKLRRSATVTLARCASRARNDLNADACTIADRIAEIAAEADDHRQFVNRVRRLLIRLRDGDFITDAEQQALKGCAAQASVDAPSQR
jgi:hypothetical protein